MRLLAITLTLGMILWLLREDSKYTKSNNISLWIPTIWFGIASSRPLGAWFIGNFHRTVNEGSIQDQIVLNGLLILSFIVIINKRMKLSNVFKDNTWLFNLYIYLLFSSIFVSDFPFNSFKRWYKISGTIIIAAVILIENDPIDALISIVRRCAYILIPMSLCLIKYFPEYSIQYSYEGIRMGTGVTTHKNSLGIMCALYTFIIIWANFDKCRKKITLKNKQLLFKDMVVTVIGLFLLFGGGHSYSATSCTIWVLCCALLIVLQINRINTLISNNFTSINIGIVILFLIIDNWLVPKVAVFLGRNPNLTDRDQIWREVLNIATQHPILGVGYGGFWGLIGKGQGGIIDFVDQAHNGYIDVFLQTGLIGLIFVSMFIVFLSKKISYLSRCNLVWCNLGFCLIPAIIIYNYTEAAMLVNSCTWVFLIFLSIVSSKYIKYNAS